MLFCPCKVTGRFLAHSKIDSNENVSCTAAEAEWTGTGRTGKGGRTGEGGGADGGGRGERGRAGGGGRQKGLEESAVCGGGVAHDYTTDSVMLTMVLLPTQFVFVPNMSARHLRTLNLICIAVQFVRKLILSSWT